MGMRKLLLGFLLSAPLAFPIGPFAVGVKGGVPFTSNFETGSAPGVTFTADTKRYTVGPVVEFRGPFGLGIEADALYRRLDFESQGNEVDIFVRQKTTANAWDIPLLLKWRLTPGPIKPYFSVGPTFRYLSNLDQVRDFFFAPGNRMTQATTDQPAQLQNRFTAGFTLSGGVQLGSHIAPEIRYTRWGWETFKDLSGVFRSNQNQVEFLVGLTF